MLGMNGFEVARKLRESPEGKGILLIALTGYGDNETRTKCKAAGFNHHMIKPADFEVLKAMIESSHGRKGALSAGR